MAVQKLPLRQGALKAKAVQSVFESTPTPSSADVMHSQNSDGAVVFAEDEAFDTFESQPTASTTDTGYAGGAVVEQPEDHVFESRPRASLADVSSLMIVSELDCSDEPAVFESTPAESPADVSLSMEASDLDCSEEQAIFESTPAESKATVTHASATTSETEVGQSVFESQPRASFAHAGQWIEPADSESEWESDAEDEA